MTLLATDKTSIRDLRKLIKATHAVYNAPGLYSIGEGCHNILANTYDNECKGARIKLESFMGCYSLSVREFVRYTRDDGKRDLIDKREIYHNITCQNYIKLRDMLKDLYFDINRI